MASMSSLDTFQKRFDFGKIAENSVFDRFKRHGIDVVLLEVGKNQKNAYQNLEEGDLKVILNGKTFFIDVKHGRSVSTKSIEKFKGDFFCFYPTKMMSDQTVYFAPVGLLYRNRILYTTTLPSGDSGYRFSNPLPKFFLSFENFLKFYK
jgi:hypothetical protein